MAVDPVLVGGGFAIAGSLVTGLLQHWSQARADRAAGGAADAARIERLYDLRRETYLRYLQAADRTWDMIANLRAQGREQHPEQPLELVGNTPSVERELAALESERQALTLIGDLDTRREAVRVQQVLTGLAFDNLREQDVLDTFERLQDCMRISTGFDDLGHPRPLHVPARRRRRPRLI